MRKIHQMEIPDPLVSEGECIEYTTIDGRVFNVLAVSHNRSGSCHGCVFHQYKDESSESLNGIYVCDWGPHGEHSLCYKGTGYDWNTSYCRFIDMDTIMENI